MNVWVNKHQPFFPESGLTTGRIPRYRIREGIQCTNITYFNEVRTNLCQYPHLLRTIAITLIIMSMCQFTITGRIMKYWSLTRRSGALFWWTYISLGTRGTKTRLTDNNKRQNYRMCSPHPNWQEMTSMTTRTGRAVVLIIGEHVWSLLSRKW